MYTKKLHERIKKIAQKYYGQGMHTESGLSLGRELTFADIYDIIEELEELQIRLKEFDEK